jgi:chloramphenicol-sensitive protein RarD
MGRIGHTLSPSVETTFDRPRSKQKTTARHDARGPIGLGLRAGVVAALADPVSNVARGERLNLGKASEREGLLAAIGAFLVWGALPAYLRPLHGISALTIMSHRLVGCCVLVTAWLAIRGELGSVRLALLNPTTRVRLMGSAVLISSNWLIYVWAVGTGRVIDSSLGYFINPLVNVLLGVLVLDERLNRAQWVSVAFAAAGVAWLTALTGRLPWVALTLAVTFGCYGLIRKVIAVEPVAGLAAETLLLTPLGLAWLWREHLVGGGAFGGASLLRSSWLLAGGLVTAVPLALFAFGARRIPYSTVGVAQYISPSMQLALGVFLFGEAFAPARAVGFAFIWTALAIYAGDGLLRAPPRS